MDAITIGHFLFKYRSFTPIPVIIVIFLFFRPQNLGLGAIGTVLGIVVSLSGESIRILAVGYAHPRTSGRESYLLAEKLNTSGIYSIVRNPLYIGNVLIFSGLLLVYSNIAAILLMGCYLFIQYYFIILSEEAYLAEHFGSQFSAYCLKTARFVPRVKNFRKPESPFNGKKVLFKENDSIFNLLIMLLFILALKELKLHGQIFNIRSYTIGAGILLILYIWVKVVKKRKKAQGLSINR